jgi:hypothetical protein
MSHLSFHSLYHFLKKQNLGKILTKIHLDLKDEYFIIDTVFKNMHISVFKTQWKEDKLFHITHGKSDTDKCSIYFKINKYNDVKEPKYFKYEQSEFSNSSSRRPKCTHHNVSLIVMALKNVLRKAT